MKSIGKLMKDMGFNANAPLDTQKAFFKHLVKDAESKQLEREGNSNTKLKAQSAQLEFKFNTDIKVS